MPPHLPRIMGVTKTSVELVVMPDCGHQQVFRARFPDMALPGRVRCDECGADVSVYAVECREWQMWCSKGCHYSRWFGADSAGCRVSADKHSVAHPDHVVRFKYRLHPDSLQYVRKQLGRKARVFIEGAPVLRVVVRYKTEEEECPF